MKHLATQCPKCEGQMEQGFIEDMTQGGRLVSSWCSGPPAKSFWMGMTANPTAIIPIGVFRCSSCGFLESFAREEFAAH